MTTPYGSSPGASSYTSSQAFIQPRYNTRATYVHRWKVLRDRNKSLPKLDFTAKASGIPKKFKGTGSFSRSYTYDSMKLPSISTCSIATGYSGKTVHSDGYRRKDTTDKKNLQDQHSESYTDLTTQRDSLAVALSKSLQSLAQEESQQKEQAKNTQSNNSHRYESITYKKHLLKRHKGAEATDKTKRSKGTYAQSKSEKDQLQKSKDREYVFVRDHTKYSPSLLVKNERIGDEDAYKKVQKSEFFILEQSGIYQIDLSSVRNEIPPVVHEPLPPVSAQTERSYRARKQQRSSKHRKQVVDKKWRDDCDCLRCDIIRRQFAEGDFESYKNWGNYPCMKLSKSRASSYMFYDSD